jgi:FKBP-type peptidyl-prolyl cis-trans isomerase SlyD
VPGLEQELEGKVPGDKFRAVVTPENGYGEKREDARRTLPRRAFPAEARITPGAQFLAQEPNGDPMPLWVVSADQNEVVVDLDHPLAGETLTFDVEVVAVRDATEEEREHGHAHIPGHHHH